VGRSVPLPSAGIGVFCSLATAAPEALVSSLRAHQQLLLCGLVMAVLVVLGTQTRPAWHLLPVYPPLCILVAGMGSTLWDRLYRLALLNRTRWLFLQQAAFILTLCGFSFSLPGSLGALLPGLLWVEDYYQARKALLQECGAQLDSQVPWYALGPPRPRVVFYGRPATEFLSKAALVGSLSTRQTPAYVLVAGAFAAQMGEHGSSVLGQRGTWRLVTYLPVGQASSEDSVPGQKRQEPMPSSWGGNGGGRGREDASACVLSWWPCSQAGRQSRHPYCKVGRCWSLTRRASEACFFSFSASR